MPTISLTCPSCHQAIRAEIKVKTGPCPGGDCEHPAAGITVHLMVDHDLVNDVISQHMDRFHRAVAEAAR